MSKHTNTRLAHLDGTACQTVFCAFSVRRERYPGQVSLILLVIMFLELRSILFDIVVLFRSAIYPDWTLFSRVDVREFVDYLFLMFFRI